LLSSQATIRLDDPARVLDALQAHLAEHDIAVVGERDRRVAALPHGGEVIFQAASRELSLEARATSQSGLEEVTSFLASHVLEFAHPERPAIQWTGFAERQAFADFREMRVLRVADLTPHMRRITLTGEDLERFATDDHFHVRLYFPQDPARPDWPVRGLDGLGIVQDPLRMPHVRKYTIRRIDLDLGEVDIDFVLHAIPGPGSDWAKDARPGALVGMAGPGGRGVRAADWYLLVGDETALPAIARALEAMPASAVGHALVEIEQASDAMPLVMPQGIRLQWIARHDRERSIVDEVRRIAIPRDRSVFCWAGTEFEAVQQIRAHWRDVGQLGKTEQLAVAYWRQGMADGG
jgi:NADPH-dependent ferric siderophore reductase